MRQIVGLALLIIGIATLSIHVPSDFEGNESARMGYIIGQITFNVMLIAGGVYLMVKKKKK